MKNRAKVEKDILLYKRNPWLSRSMMFYGIKSSATVIHVITLAEILFLFHENDLNLNYISK